MGSAKKHSADGTLLTWTKGICIDKVGKSEQAFAEEWTALKASEGGAGKEALGCKRNLATQRNKQ